MATEMGNGRGGNVETVQTRNKREIPTFIAFAQVDKH